MPAKGRSRDLVAAIAERYQISFEDVVPSPGGSVNDVYFLGEELVVRIPRGGGAPVAELEKEAAVIPTARRAGVRTPAVLTYDKSCTVIDVPYMVVERVHARDLALLNVAPKAAGGAYYAAGRSLARLHELRRSRVGSLSGVVVDDDKTDPREVVERLALDGYIDSDQARWLAGWFTTLGRRRPVDVEPVLLHGDIAPQNLLVDRDATDLAALVDWGDAAWGDPAMEFAKVPLRALPYVLAGYRAGSPGSPDHRKPDAAAGSGRPGWHGWQADGGAWEARALWYHLHWALGGLSTPPRVQPRVWTAPPAARLFEILRFFAQAPPEPWAHLARF